ncbi:MAG: hypothetical protein NUV97_02795, partial [archaeon]|nr:hypothetical protein [archaeon]
DQPNNWNINASIQDNDENYAENAPQEFLYNELQAMVMSPTALTWPELNMQSTLTGSNNDPILMNNTGNMNFSTVQVLAHDLVGTTDASKTINATAFKGDIVTEGCAGTNLQNSSTQEIIGAVLPTRTDGSEALGQENIFFCLTIVPSTATAQDYSSATYGSWTIEALLVLLTIKKRKRNKLSKKEHKELVSAVGLILEAIKQKHNLKNIEAIELLVKRIKKESVGAEDELVNSIDSILDEVREEVGLDNKQMITLFVDNLGKKYNIGKKIIREIEGINTTTISVSVFSSELGGLEALVKYMKENLGMDYNEIAEELNRDYRTIWTAYNKSREKKKSLALSKEGLFVPAEIFKDRRLTVFEALVLYLKNKGMKYSEMGDLLNRDQRNMWTICSRAMKK